jgi:hypothetical protein
MAPQLGAPIEIDEATPMVDEGSRDEGFRVDEGSRDEGCMPSAREVSNQG